MERVQRPQPRPDRQEAARSCAEHRSGLAARPRIWPCRTRTSPMSCMSRATCRYRNATRPSTAHRPPTCRGNAAAWWRSRSRGRNHPAGGSYLPLLTIEIVDPTEIDLENLELGNAGGGSPSPTAGRSLCCDGNGRLSTRPHSGRTVSNGNLRSGALCPTRRVVPSVGFRCRRSTRYVGDIAAATRHRQARCHSRHLLSSSHTRDRFNLLHPP